MVWCEICWHERDAETPMRMRAIQGHCSPPTAYLEFLRMTQILHRWTDATYHVSCSGHLMKIARHGLLQKGLSAQEGSQACYSTTAHPWKSTTVPNPNSYGPQVVPYKSTTSLGTARSASTLARARNIGRCFCQTPRWCVTHFGDFLE